MVTVISASAQRRLNTPCQVWQCSWSGLLCSSCWPIFPSVGWVGLDSLLIITYVVAVQLIHGNRSKASHDDQMKIFRGTQFTHRFNRFGLARIVPCFIIPSWCSADGSLNSQDWEPRLWAYLVALVTSSRSWSPSRHKLGRLTSLITCLEVTCLTCLPGTDDFFLPMDVPGGPWPSFLLVGMVGLIMTGIGLVGNLAHIEKRLWKFRID